MRFSFAPKLRIYFFLIQRCSETLTPFLSKCNAYVEADPTRRQNRHSGNCSSQAYQNRRQNVFNSGVLHLCGGLDILIIDKTPTNL